MKHIEAFNKFLDKEVNLNPNRIDRLNRSVKTVREYLGKNLDSFVKVEQQGSYALKTIIRPHNSEYDADILLYMKAENTKKPADYLDDIYNCFRKDRILAEKAGRGTRSVTLEYAGDFHLDVVPCIARRQQYYICNSKANQFEPTDGTAYRDWFNAKTEITSGNLKLATRLLKYMKNHKRNFEVSSIILTTLIGNSINENENSAKARAKFNSVPDTLLIVTRRINSFLQNTSAMPRIRNPKLRSERFTKRHWAQNDYLQFKNMFNIYTGKIYDAYHESNERESLRKWRELFGDNFGR